MLANKVTAKGALGVEMFFVPPKIFMAKFSFLKSFTTQ